MRPLKKRKRDKAGFPVKADKKMHGLFIQYMAQ